MDSGFLLLLIGGLLIFASLGAAAVYVANMEKPSLSGFFGCDKDREGRGAAATKETHLIRDQTSSFI